MIYCVKHKPGELVLPDGYKELKVGALFDQPDTDNINHINLQINELTGLYWLWKNTDDEILGLCHYRRYFDDNGQILSWNKAKKLVKKHGLIVQNTFTHYKPLKDNLADHFPYHYDIFLKYYGIFVEREPGLANYFDSEWFNPQHIFVAEREFVDNYCDWLFPLIVPIAEQFKAEDAPKDSEMIFQRMISYFSERLLTYYIQETDTTYIELPVRRTE